MCENQNTLAETEAGNNLNDYATVSAAKKT